MVIQVEHVEEQYTVLELLFRLSDHISLDEADILIQVCVHILSGLRKKEDILEVFHRSASKVQDSERFGKIIDQYKIIKYLIDKINK